MSKQSIRAERRAKRAARLRRQRLLLILLAILLLLLIAVFAYQRLTQPEATNPESGLAVEHLIVDTGAKAKTDDAVAVRYAGMWINGQKLDCTSALAPNFIQ